MVYTTEPLIKDQESKQRSIAAHPEVNPLFNKLIVLFDDLLHPDKPIQPIVLDNASDLQALSITKAVRTANNGDYFESGSTHCIFIQERINDIRYINKFLEAVNGYLPIGGLFIGCVQTSALRKNAIREKMGDSAASVYHHFDYVLHRVFPKLPYLKKIYFALTKGHDRVITEMETYGRLYSCGFCVVNNLAINGMLYFIAKKVNLPEYNLNATYGPIITLYRHGQNKKQIKVYKLRTMYPYSEYVQEFVYERQGLQEGGKFKDDPRISSVGRICRKFWLDEIPMLYNILKGDIKLVGVRPLSTHYMSLYPKEFQEFRSRFKPGLIPPYYVDFPKTLEEIIDSEERYLKAYERNKLRTDLIYLYRAFYNIVIKGYRSR